MAEETCKGSGLKYKPRSLKWEWRWDGIQAKKYELRECPECGKYLRPKPDGTLRPHKPLAKKEKKVVERTLNPFIHCRGSYQPAKKSKNSWSSDRGVCSVCAKSVPLLVEKGRIAGRHKTEAKFAPCAECGNLVENDYLCNDCRLAVYA